MADLTLAQTVVYLFCLTIVLILTYLSALAYKNNKPLDDKIEYQKLYEQKKRSNVAFYSALFKKKFWILGVFGVYISIFMFIGLLAQLTFNSSLTDLTNLLSDIILVMGYFSIIFMIFWVVYLIIFFYNSMVETMKYQFGKDTWRAR